VKRRAGEVGKRGVYRGKSSLSLLENLSKSATARPGLNVHEIGTGVLALAGMGTAATGWGIKAEHRLLIMPVVNDVALAGSR
jgi:hypothetical protein